GYFDPAATAFFRALERALARRTTRLVAVSPEVRDDLVALGVAPAEKFSVIRLGIDLDRRITAPDDDGASFRRLFGVRPDEFVVGWVGRMTAIKRGDEVLRAFHRPRGRRLEARRWPPHGPSSRRASEGRPTSSKTAPTGCSSRSATSTRSLTRSSASRATPSSGGASASTGVSE